MIHKQDDNTGENSDDRFGSREEFFKYYAEQSTTPETVQRFAAIRDMVCRAPRARGLTQLSLNVLDIGCGAGTQSMMWARDGHCVSGLDVNGPLVELAIQRTREAKLDIDFRIGTATELPWADNSVDVCLVPELLEHVREWEPCVNEFTRVLKPGGVLFLSTTNTLCPIQQEFNLPLYSWYPAFLKRRYEQQAVTTRPELVNYAKYPAVNWFTFFGLRKVLAARGFDSFDRFDVADNAGRGFARALAFGLIRYVPLARLLAHVATPYTLLVAVKRK